jgi:hypothetical protein
MPEQSAWQTPREPIPNSQTRTVSGAFGAGVRTDRFEGGWSVSYHDNDYGVPEFGVQSQDGEFVEVSPDMEVRIDRFNTQARGTLFVDRCIDEVFDLVLLDEGGSIALGDLEVRELLAPPAAAQTVQRIAAVINDDGHAILPSSESISEAAAGVDIPDDFRFRILNVGGQGYPIAGTSWVLAWTCGYSEPKAEALRAWLRFSLEEGDHLVRELNYAPLPSELENRVLRQVERVNEHG